jgi:hypothetical protein
VSDDDIRQTIRAIPAMCDLDASVIWTRHRRQPDLTPLIAKRFIEVGCLSKSFVSPGVDSFSVGREMTTRHDPNHQIPSPLFTFRTAPE